MKLISMTDFVLEVKNNIENDLLDSDRVEELKKIIKYADFLKQPLKLEMFICSVTEPEIQGGYAGYGTFVGGYNEKWIEEYYEAKDKVLFDGFNIYANGDLYNEFVTFESSRLEIMNVENLINDFQYSFYLTPNAIKHIFG